jgi:hypothetical protein
MHVAGIGSQHRACGFRNDFAMRVERFNRNPLGSGSASVEKLERRVEAAVRLPTRIVICTIDSPGHLTEPLGRWSRAHAPLSFNHESRRSSPDLLKEI